MNELREFSYEGSQVRTTMIDGEPWFIAKDVCAVLEISKYRDAVVKLDDDERVSTIMDTLGGHQMMTAVSEAGLYTLIFQSRTPQAKDFRRWITHEVIPTIRKTGSYAKPESIEDLIILQAQSMKELRAKVDQVNIELQVTKHRIDNLDRVDIVGDEQQRLNKMIRKYAHDNGLTFQKAWREFTDRFNTAFRTNLTQRVENYREKHGLRDLSRPQYLSLVGQIEDAIRVADKMLNLVEVG